MIALHEMAPELTEAEWAQLMGEPADEQQECGLRFIQGIILGLILSIPLWVAIILAVRAVVA